MHPAEQFFLKEWNCKKHHVHSKAVIRACMGMIEGTTFDPQVFILAGWIHDMGKKHIVELHHRESIKFLDMFMTLHPQFMSYTDVVQDCILNHRTRGNPETMYGRIFQVADKVALEDKQWLSFKEELKKEEYKKLM